MATLRFGPEDRDERGRIKPAEPRTLADLLPTPASIEQSAQPAAPPMSHAQLLIGGALALVAAALIFVVLGRTAAPGARVAPTALAGSASASTPASAPTVAAARLLVAFAAPDGNVLGAIESTRPMKPTAHYGNDWIQADVRGSGLVWLRASDAPELALTGPDLAPPTPAPATARPAVAAPPPPVPTDAPHCVTVGTTGNTIERCGYESLDDLQATAQAAWIAQSGAVVVPVANATPYPERK